MAERRAVVVIDGNLKELPVGDTLLGASGSGVTIYTASAEVDFGTGSSTNAEAVISAAWAGDADLISVMISPNLTDHDYEDVVIENLKVVVGEVDPGVSFTVYVHAPDDTWGRYTITLRGIG